MPRRGNVPKREILPDPMYNSVLVTKLINGVMLDGKKGVAQKVVYDAFDIIKEKTGKEPLDAFTEAMNNIMPALEVKARRVGGATYQVPIEVRPARRQTLALRWLVDYSRKRSVQPQAQREDHERAPRRRDHGRLQQPRQLCEEARGYAQERRGQQGFRALQMVIPSGEINAQTVFT